VDGNDQQRTLGEALDVAKIPRERFAALKPGQVVEI